MSGHNQSHLVCITQALEEGQSKTTPAESFRTSPMPGTGSAVARSLGAMSAGCRVVRAELAQDGLGFRRDGDDRIEPGVAQARFG